MKEEDVKFTKEEIMGMIFCFGVIIIAILFVIFVNPAGPKEYEKACIEKLNTMPELNNCVFVKQNYIAKNVIECSCVKNSQLQKYVLMGNEVPK